MDYMYVVTHASHASRVSSVGLYMYIYLKYCSVVVFTGYEDCRPPVLVQGINICLPANEHFYCLHLTMGRCHQQWSTEIDILGLNISSSGISMAQWVIKGQLYTAVQQSLLGDHLMHPNYYRRTSLKRTYF